jgi:hypothetical protein
LLTHWLRLAASRADCTAGSNSEIRTAIIAMTTRSSMSVKARFARPEKCIVGSTPEISSCQPPFHDNIRQNALYDHSIKDIVVTREVHFHEDFMNL